jgi:hypothetical protein
MAMKLLTFHDLLVAFLPPYDQDNNFLFLDIIQGTQVARAKLEFGQRIRPQAFDCSCRGRGLVREPGQDGRFQVSLVTYWQRL